MLLLLLFAGDVVGAAVVGVAVVVVLFIACKTKRTRLVRCMLMQNKAVMSLIKSKEDVKRAEKLMGAARELIDSAGNVEDPRAEAHGATAFGLTPLG